MHVVLVVTFALSVHLHQHRAKIISSSFNHQETLFDPSSNLFYQVTSSPSGVTSPGSPALVTSDPGDCFQAGGPSRAVGAAGIHAHLNVAPLQSLCPLTVMNSPTCTRSIKPHT